MELSTLLVLGGLGAVLALFAFCEVQDRKREAASAKARKKREIDLLVAYCMLMEEHEATLKLRVRQATYHDPYGRPVLDKAFKELSYFFDEVLVREIAPAGERDYKFLKTTFDRWVKQLEVEPPPPLRPTATAVSSQSVRGVSFLSVTYIFVLHLATL